MLILLTNLGFPMKFRRTVLSVAVASAVATLTACGGGGGGGGGGGIYNSPSPTVRPDVPFHTPVRVGSVTPVNSAERESDSSALYSVNLSSSTSQEVVIAGRMAPDSGTYNSYNLSIFGWQNGTLVDKSSQWFSGSDRVVLGTEPSIRFADFDGDGKTDMYVAPNTDTNVYGPGSVFFNNGTNFTRNNINVGNINGHDSAVYDMNGDGRSDILTLSFGPDLRISFGNANRTFTTYANTSSVGDGAGVAVGDFMGTGGSSIVVVGSLRGNYLYNWGINNGNLSLSQVSQLPTSRFLLPKWASYNFSGAHDVRALAFDFDNSGRTSAVLFSRPWFTNGQWPHYSEVQFLKNNGNGVFVDVTDTTLIGYDHATHVSYNPKLMDVNNDGLVDIVLSAPNWTSNSGSQVLLHTREHKYVASYATVLQAFQDQALNLEKAINASAHNGANGIVFVQGPDGAMYLATAVSYLSSGIQQKAIYLSKLGSTTANAQATADAVKQVWPWMSDAQVNTVLAQSSTTWFGLNVLDSQKALQPVGALGIPVNGRILNLGGYLGGFKLDNSVRQMHVLDSIGRNFVVDYAVTTGQTFNMFSRNIDNLDDNSRSDQLAAVPMYRYNNVKIGVSDDNRNMVVGVSGLSVGKNLSLNATYSRLPFSPFVQMVGSWGMVKSSSILETSLTHNYNNWVTRGGIMYAGTEIESGLVQRVNPITSVWAEAGYQWSNFRLFGGMLPRVIAGSADITLPTGIDSQGRVQYNNTRAEIYSPVVHYARFSYNERINKNTSFRINGMITTQQQTTVMGELRFNF